MSDYPFRRAARRDRKPVHLLRAMPFDMATDRNAHSQPVAEWLESDSVYPNLMAGCLWTVPTPQLDVGEGLTYPAQRVRCWRVELTGYGSVVVVSYVGKTFRPVSQSMLTMEPAALAVLCGLIDACPGFLCDMSPSELLGWQLRRCQMMLVGAAVHFARRTWEEWGADDLDRTAVLGGWSDVNNVPCVNTTNFTDLRDSATW